MTKSQLFSWCLGWILALNGAAYSAPPRSESEKPISDLIPADSLVAFRAKPQNWLAPASQPTSQVEQLSGTAAIAQILAFLSASRMVPDEGQVFSDIATALPLLGRYEYAIVLIDISSRVVQNSSSQGDNDETELSLRLEQMRGAIIFRTGGEHREVVEQLNRIIGRYTNEEVARLESHSGPGQQSQRLIDERLPGWAVWEWGPMGDFFVVSFGSGAFEAVAQTHQGQRPCLTNDKWYQKAGEKTQSPVVMMQCYLALEKLKHRLGTVVSERSSRVLTALGANKVTQDLWTIGLNGKAITWYRCFQREGQDQIRFYSDPQAFSAENTRIVPPEAAHYAVIRVPTQWLFKDLPRAWVSARSDSQFQTWSRIWQRLEDESGLNLDDTLVKHIQSNVVLFDYPPHPLKIPLALTIAFEIDDHESVRAAVNSLLNAWSRYLDDRAKRSRSSLVRMRVLRDKDGIWYLRAGILGPALKVTNRYIVISWSPQALRQALRYIEKQETRDSSETLENGSSLSR